MEWGKPERERWPGYWTEEVEEGEWYITVPLVEWEALMAKLERYEEDAT